MKNGSKRVLINHPPYTPFGHNDRQPTFIIVEVVESRESKCGYTGNTSPGYIAKGSDGYMYGYQFPDPESSWSRWMSDDEFKALNEEEKNALIKDYLWYDLAKYQAPAQANYTKGLDFIDYCETHQHHYYSSVCRRCEVNLGLPEVIMSKKEHNWPGWY